MQQVIDPGYTAMVHYLAGIMRLMILGMFIIAYSIYKTR